MSSMEDHDSPSITECSTASTEPYSMENENVSNTENTYIPVNVFLTANTGRGEISFRITT
jgi:hypothetical protein